MAVGMIYGDYDFSTYGPIPVFTYSRAVEQTPGDTDGFCLASPITMTLEGIIMDPPNTVTGGFDHRMNQVVSGLSHHFKCGNYQQFQITGCDGNLIVSTSGKVTNLEISPRIEADPYVKTASYTIGLQIPSLTGLTYDGQNITEQGINSIDENWTIEFLDERDGALFSGTGTSSNSDVSLQQAFRVAHSVTVGANPSPAQTASSALTVALNYLRNNYNPTGMYSSGEVTGLFDIGMGTYQPTVANHFRSVTQNRYAGTASMEESWIATTDTYAAYEDFDISVEVSEEADNDVVNVNGVIHGLAELAYTGVVGVNGIVSNKSKIQNAFDKFYNQVSGSIYGRANKYYEAHGNFLNPKPLTSTFGYNSVAGTVTYNYTYDGRPENLNPCAKSERITITENEPNDVFAALTVIKRPYGPLLQGIGSSGVRTREINIEAVLEVPKTGFECSPLTGTDGCLTGFSGEGCCEAYPLGWFSLPNSYDAVIEQYEACNVTPYAEYFLNNYNKSFDIKTGRFSLNKSYTVSNCPAEQ